MLYLYRHNTVTCDMSIKYMYDWLFVEDYESDKYKVPDTRHVTCMENILSMHKKEVLITTNSLDELKDKVKYYYILSELER